MDQVVSQVGECHQEALLDDDANGAMGVAPTGSDLLHEMPVVSFGAAREVEHSVWRPQCPTRETCEERVLCLGRPKPQSIKLTIRERAVERWPVAHLALSTQRHSLSVSLGT